MRSTLRVPDGGPLFEGHFPGRPILPGIVELALVLDAVAMETGRPPLARAIRVARLRQLVFPRDVLTLDTRDGSEGRGSTRFDLVRDDIAVANGEILLGDPEPVDDWSTSVAAGSTRSIPPIETLIPHRGAMRFVDEVVGEAEDGLTCAARVPTAYALAQNGRAHALTAVEAAAQTAAVWESLRRFRAEETEADLGFLVSLRDVVFHRADVPTDAPLTSSVRLEASAPPLAHYDAAVSWDGHPVMRGRIGVWVTDRRTLP